MTIEQFEKIYNLLTGIIISTYLSLILLLVIALLVFGYIYNNKLDKDIEVKERNKRILDNRISKLESDISKLDYWLTSFMNNNSHKNE